MHSDLLVCVPLAFDCFLLALCLHFAYYLFDLLFRQPVCLLVPFYLLAVESFLFAVGKLVDSFFCFACFWDCVLCALVWFVFVFVFRADLYYIC